MSGEPILVHLPVWESPTPGGPERVQAVPVDHLGELPRYRLLYSPGTTQGFAAGDVIEMRSDGPAVVSRGGNISVRSWR